MEDPSQGKDVELARTIEQHVDLRTWRRIHRLRVEVTDGRVVIHGHASSYYIKQLALLAVLEVLGSPTTTEAVLDIRVGSTPDHARQDRHVHWAGVQPPATTVVRETGPTC